MSYVPTLKKLYTEQIAAELVKSRGYKNKHQVPKLTKISINTGIDAGFIGRWLHAFLVAWPIAVVAAFFCAPIARRWTMRLLRMPPSR